MYCFWTHYDVIKEVGKFVLNTTWPEKKNQTGI
jgi:hypothetical protein